MLTIIALCVATLLLALITFLWSSDDMLNALIKLLFFAGTVLCLAAGMVEILALS